MIGVLAAIIAGALIIILLMTFTSLSRKKSASDQLTSKKRSKSDAAIIKDCNKKIERDPSNVSALTLLADLYYEEKNYEKALPLYDRLLNLTKKDDAINTKKFALRYGICCYKNGKIDDAGRSFVIVLKEDPSDFQANMYIGCAYYEKKDFEKALIFLKKAYVANPVEMEVLEYLGKTLYEVKRYKEALGFFKKCLDVHPENKELMFLYASSCEELNLNEQALKIFMLLRLDPQFGSEACLACAAIHERFNQPENVIQDYEIALKADSMDKEKKLSIMYKLAQCYIKKNDIAKGLSVLRQIQMVSNGYKDIDILIRRYQELNQNSNLQTYLLSSVNDFTMLCRKFVLNFYKDAKVKIEDVKVYAEGLEILAQVFSDKWEALEMFKFFRSTGAVGELYIRDFHAKMRDIKCEKGYCVTAGSYTEEAKKYVEGRPIDLLDKQKLIIALKRLEK